MQPSVRTEAAASCGGRILVVDDEEGLAKVIGRKLRAAGYDVHLAYDGTMAVKALDELTFDAIFSDIDMPKMDGIELLRTVRQRDLDVPVVLMTGNPHVNSAVLAIEYGAMQYLVEPFELGELERVASRAFHLNQLARLKRKALALFNHGGHGEPDRLSLGATFDRALATLQIVYQPIVRASDRSLFGYEALLRSGENALPHPGAILDAAERLARLGDLGQRIRSAACVPVPDAPPHALFFVNLHSRDLMDDTLLSPTSPLSLIASRVVLEITERASLAGVTDVQAKLTELRRMGFRIAIDDLGAGYSGLTSFTVLEPEFVKLDMSLVRDVDRDRKKEKLVRSMTTLCKDLGITVVAEGVESTGELDALVEIGCDLLQGYRLAKPGKPFPAFAW